MRNIIAIFIDNDTANPLAGITFEFSGHFNEALGIGLHVFRQQIVVKHIKRKIACIDTCLVALCIIKGLCVGTDHHTLAPHHKRVAIRPIALIMLHALHIPLMGEVIMLGRAVLYGEDTTVEPHGVRFKPSSPLWIVVGHKTYAKA